MVTLLFSRKQLRKQIYGALSAYLERECCIDSDEPEYHDQLFPEQQRLAAEFRKKAIDAPPVPGGSSSAPKR